MPGLVRGMARTAAVVGTATATRNAVNRRQADKNAQAYAQAALRDFKHYEGRAADMEARAQQLLNGIAQALAGLPP